MSNESTGNYLPSNDSSPSDEVIEISLLQIIGFFKKYWIVFFVSGFVSAAIGIGISYLFPKQYASSAKILPEYSSGMKTGGLGALASIAGISLGENSEAIRPDLYPNILQSRPFLMQLLTTPLPTQADTFALLPLVIGSETIEPFTREQLARADTILTLTEGQEKVFKNLSERISASNDKLTGILSIGIELPDPIMAAAATNLMVNYLKDFVADYRTTKESDKVRFLQKQLAESKSRYQKAEYALNTYRDRNQNTFSNVARIEEQRLQSEYLQTQTIYNTLTQQLEAARLKLQEEAPVLKVLEPPMVANHKSNPKRSLFAFGFGVLGSLSALIFVLIKRK